LSPHGSARTVQDFWGMSGARTRVERLPRRRPTTPVAEDTRMRSPKGVFVQPVSVTQ
jgi:hypothetical protein